MKIMSIRIRHCRIKRKVFLLLNIHASEAVLLLLIGKCCAIG
ncbi:conserved hypothetical protein [delta proteobacterium NaphS2]|nr:conserved hypothetical protein [delta proteobacterium NaphS2]